MFKKFFKHKMYCAFMAILSISISVMAQTTEFTYRGEISVNNGIVASCDHEFKLIKKSNFE